VIDNAKQLGHDEPSGGTKAMSNNETHDSTTAFEAASGSCSRHAGSRSPPGACAWATRRSLCACSRRARARRSSSARALNARAASRRRADRLTQRRDHTPVPGPECHRTPRGRAGARRLLRRCSRGHAPAGLSYGHGEPHVARYAPGRPRPENFLSDAELQRITAPVLMIWGDEDPYGGPEIGRRAAALIPDAQLEVIPARHAPFLDDPQRCGALIDQLLRRVAAPADGSRSDETTRSPTA